MKKLSALYLFAVFLLSLNSFGQTSVPNPSSTPPVTEDNSIVRISTNLIQVDATVVDKNGSIVKGLSADDFEIYENGKRQPITNFSFVEIQPRQAAEGAPAITRKNKNLTPLPPTSTNLRPEQVRRTIALVVDDLDLSFGSVDSVRAALKKYVDEQMQPDDLVAIIRTGGGGGFLQQFTSDKRILYRAIEKLRWNPAGNGKINSFVASDASDTNGAMPGTTAGDLAIAGKDKLNNFNEDVFAIGSLGAVNYVVKGMRELPGRKAVVLFSEGFKLYEQDSYDAEHHIKRENQRLMESFRRLTELANRSSVVIYAMDTRGVAVTMPEAADGVSPAGGGDKFTGGGGERSDKVANDRYNDLYETQQGLRALADQTGGFAIINNNNLSKGIERVLNDQKGYYLLGYQPDDETFDPKKAKFNTLTVKLRRSDLRVRYRSGFYGIKDEEIKAPTQTPRQQILAALTSPLSSGEMDLQLTSLFASDTKTGDFMRSMIYVDGNDLKFIEDADGWQKATFDVVAMIFGENGAVIDEVSRTETIKVQNEALKEIREKGFVATVTVPIKKPGAYQMRIVIRDTATSRVGSASQFIEVPNLRKDHLTLSGILLQRISSPSVTDKNTNQKNQFQADEQRDMAIRTFHAGMNVNFGYAIYNANLNKATNSPDLTMQFKIFRKEKQIFASREKSVKFVDKSDLQHILAEGIFTLGKEIQPGDYVLQVIVKDLTMQGQNQVTTQWIDFEVAK